MLKRNIELCLWAIFLSILSLPVYANVLSSGHTLLVNDLRYASVIIPVLAAIYFLMTRWEDRYLFLIIALIALAFIFRLRIAKLSYLALAAAFCVYTPNEIAKIYRSSLGLTFILTFASGLAVNRVRSNIDNVFSFGFFNENQTGYILALLAILATLKIGRDKIKLNWNVYNIVFFAAIFLLVTLLFKDRTAELMMVVYLVLLGLKRLFSSKIALALITFLPIFLAWFAYWSAMNYGTNNFLAVVNRLSTSRLMMWSYYFSHQSLTLFGNNIVVNKGWGIGYTPGQGLFDGAYAYFLFAQGIVFSIIVFLGLALANFKLMLDKQYLLTAVMVALEIAAFTENLPFSADISFAVIFALIAYTPKWLARRQYKEELNEQ